jgi:hypothetical protein
MQTPCLLGTGSLRWGTYIGTSLGFTPISFKMLGSRKARLPEGQMATLRRVDESHGYGTRSARSGLLVGSDYHRLVAYRVPARLSKCQLFFVD